MSVLGQQADIQRGRRYVRYGPQPEVRGRAANFTKNVRRTTLHSTATAATRGARSVLQRPAPTQSCSPISPSTRRRARASTRWCSTRSISGPTA